MNPKVWGILVLLLVLWTVLAILAPHSFLQGNNLENLLRRTAMHGLLSLGVAFVIITGGIDLSIGSLIGLSGCVLASLVQVHYERPTSPGSESGFPILRIQQGPGTAARICFQRPPVDPRPRDHLLIFNTTGATSELTIDRVEVHDGETCCHVREVGTELGDFEAVIPMYRRPRMPLWLGILCVVGLGAAVGCSHGLLVTRFAIQPFVVTLCGLLIYRGIARWLVDDRTMGFGTEYADSLGALATGKIPLWSHNGATWGIPYVAFLFAFMAAMAAIFLNRTIWGRYLLAVGCNREAARYAGIHVNRITILAYIICSMLTVVGAITFAADSNSIAPSSFGNFFELYAIAAAVLGGCSLRGGEGSILGVVLGTALMQTLYNLIVLLRISDKLEFAVIGGVILLGVVADELVRRWMAQRRSK